MKPPKLSYWDPSTVDEAVRFLAEHADEAKVLAGGQSLMPVISMRLARPEYLVDINNIADLDYIRPDGDRLRIGALARQDALVDSAEVRRLCAPMAKALPYIGHIAIRYRGTIGGSIVHADPSAELPAIAILLDAELTLAGPSGTRAIPARDFFLSFFTTAIEPDEVLAEISFPTRTRPDGSAVLELARRHGDFAVAGVAVAVETDGNQIGAARICAFGVDEVPRRIEEAETMLVGQDPSEGLIAEAGAATARNVEPESDMHASADYRREMAGVLTRRALGQALAEAATEKA